ncbi:MAG: amidohydrolase family protein [Acidobacteriota bacterium]|nr:amidohydrolase family protein [Blastocatellia bacterium]MDW8239691.1 amidohydrolase family protein [Acidobacteriota bacterium]
MRRSQTLLLMALLVSFGLTTMRFSSAAQGPVYAIKNAQIVTMAGPPIERGTVVIRNGRIAAVGANVSIPGNAQVIEAAGLAVYPGMIDSHTSIGLTEIGQVRATVDTTELGEFNPHMRAIVAVHPASELIPVTRLNGITSVITRPAGGTLSGQAALINLDGWTWEEMALKPSVGIVFNYPSLRSGRFFDFNTFEFQERSFERAKRERDEKLDKIRKLLDDTRAYIKAKEARSRSFNPDHVLEALIPVVKGDMPLIVSAERQRDITSAIEFTSEQKVKMILSGGDEAWKVASLLKEKNIPVLLGPILSLPNDEDEPYDQPFTTAKKLLDAGVKFAFQTGDSSNARNLPYHAAMCVAFGLPREEALKALTIYPAQIWGVADQIGSIEVGKLANLAVWDGDPLEIRSQVKHLFIKGRSIPLKSKHTELYERYRNRP